MFVYLDIETIPGQQPGLRERIAADLHPPGNMKKAETIAKWAVEEKPFAVEDAYRKTSFDGARGHVVCIAWAFDNDRPESLQWDPFRDDPADPFTEADLLALFFERLATHQRLDGRVPCFVGHNVRDFDLRFLFQRAVVLGIRPPLYLPHNARPGSDAIYDTMTEWAGWGGRIKLDSLCRALDIPIKGSELGGEDIDGSKVWDFVQAGRLSDVVTYCMADVRRVRAVHRRMTFAEPINAALATSEFG